MIGRVEKNRDMPPISKDLDEIALIEVAAPFKGEIFT
jgi:hypothetical protein